MAKKDSEYRRTSATCPLCCKGPFVLSNLYKHMRMYHYCEEEDIRQLSEDIRRRKFKNNPEFLCDICGRMLFSSKALKNHKRSDHGYYGISNHIVTCPGCPAVFHKQIQLAEHCLEKHSDGGADFTIVRQEFTSMDDCEAWRCDMERKTSTRFTKRGTWSRIDGTITTKYGCNRARGDGDLVDPLEQRQRFRRTERIHKYCPAFFVQNERKDATIDVVACFGHYGHKLVDSSDPPSPPDQSHHDEELEQGAPPAKHSRRITPRQTRILRGHREALALYTGKENLVVELGERKWKVLSETNDDDEGCTVTLNDASCSCDTENYHCERCGACAARFTCSCQDGYPYVIPCVHAHAVATFAEQAIELIGPIRKRLADESIPQTSSAVHLDAAPLSSARSKKPPLILKPTPEEECVKPKTSPKNVDTDNLMRVYRDCQMTYAAFGEFLKTLYKDRRRMAIATVESVMTDTMSMLSEQSPRTVPVRVTNRIMRRVALLSSQAPTYPSIRSVQTVAKPLAGNTASSSSDTDVKMSFMEQECKSEVKVSEGVAASLMPRGVPMNSSESRLIVRKRAQLCPSSVRAVCSPDKQFRSESGLSEGVAATGPAVRNVPMQVTAKSPLMKSTAVHPSCAVNTTSAMDQECKREDTSSEGLTTTRVLTSNGCSMDRECRSEPVSEGVPATRLLAESVPVQVATPRPLNPPGAAQTIQPTEQDGST